jgi:hypothetical protein
MSPFIPNDWRGTNLKFSHPLSNSHRMLGTHTHTSIDLFYAALVHFPYHPSTSSKMLPCVPCSRCIQPIALSLPVPLRWAKKRWKGRMCLFVRWRAAESQTGLTSTDSLGRYFSNLKIIIFLKHFQVVVGDYYCSKSMHKGILLFIFSLF